MWICVVLITYQDLVWRSLSPCWERCQTEVSLPAPQFFSDECFNTTTNTLCFLNSFLREVRSGLEWAKSHLLACRLVFTGRSEGCHTSRRSGLWPTFHMSVACWKFIFGSVTAQHCCRAVRWRGGHAMQQVRGGVIPTAHSNCSGGWCYRQESFLYFVGLSLVVPFCALWFCWTWISNCNPPEIHWPFLESGESYKMRAFGGNAEGYKACYASVPTLRGHLQSNILKGLGSPSVWAR